ncbi:MAG: peptidoglycan-associated lipoprotein Pal [Dissulfurimicrobium sp.]|uniref:peptidoglycan-associated lipoprotein Pal n=1 Tax=Dissulfurimicrobium sp. TaxID=2022436 RepID=UPI004048F176
MFRGKVGLRVLFLIVVSLMMMVVFSGCAKKKPVSAPTPAPTEVSQAPVTTESAVKGEEPEGIKTADQISEGRTSAPMLPIYFDFDRYNIRDDMKSRIDNNAKFLMDNPQIRIEIQGNCDERGSSEYNLALGEKRAKAARDYLIKLGVAADRIDVVSFGKEQPLDPGHNETAWAKNRRDDFVIVKK